MSKACGLGGLFAAEGAVISCACTACSPHTHDPVPPCTGERASPLHMERFALPPTRDVRCALICRVQCAEHVQHCPQEAYVRAIVLRSR